MANYSKDSIYKLATCHSDLQLIFAEVIKNFDHSVVCGHRNQQEQDTAFSEGKSEKKWPDGNHNKLPSMAVDAVPYPIDWKDKNRILYFAGFVMGIAEALFKQGLITHKVKWGGDWNENTELNDQKFNDLVHFEIIP